MATRMTSFMKLMVYVMADMGACEGGLWIYLRANMGSRERAVMGLESQAISARVTEHFVTIFSKTCNNIK